jgi:hypothetical protein
MKFSENGEMMVLPGRIHSWLNDALPCPLMRLKMCLMAPPLVLPQITLENAPLEIIDKNRNEYAKFQL